MNRDIYIASVTRKLCSLATELHINGGMNLLSGHVHSEYFFRDLLNAINSDLDLVNANDDIRDMEGFDLISTSHRIIIQVSADSSRQKINHSLTRKALKDYHGYRFMFVFIVGKKPKYQDAEFENIYGMNFDVRRDVWDISDLIRRITALDISRMQRVWLLVDKELGDTQEKLQSDSVMSTIVSRISNNSEIKQELTETTQFDIHDKILFNHLEAMQDYITDYAMLTTRLSAIYAEFDKAGTTKTKAALMFIHNRYRVIKRTQTDPERIFELVSQSLVDFVTGKGVEPGISEEQILYAVEIIVVDAFMRCKIFEKPLRKTPHVVA